MIKEIAFLVVVLFAFLGAFVTIVVIHELIHSNDLKEFANNESSITIFRFTPDFKEWSTGYYEFFPKDTLTEEDKLLFEISASETEWRAAKMTLATLAVMIYLFVMFFRERKDKKEELKYWRLKR